MLNYRYATTSMLADIGMLDKNEGLPYWQDLSFKINLPTKHAGDFQLFGIGGKSGVVETAMRDSLDWEYEYSALDSKFHSNMGAAGASHRIFLGENTYIKTVISASGRNTGHHTDSLDANYQNVYNGNSKTTENSMVVSSFVNHKFNSNSVIRTGVIVTRKSFDVFARDYTVVIPHELKVLVNSNASYVSLQSYFQWKYRINENFEVNTGVHSIYTAFNDRYTLEPRAGVK